MKRHLSDITPISDRWHLASRGGRLKSPFQHTKRTFANVGDNNISEAIKRYISLWNLIPEGVSFNTDSSTLLPVRWNGSPAMLKIAKAEEERTGNSLMTWWNGEGAARVLAYDFDAVLLERAEGTASLTELATQGYDDDASSVICKVVARLHAHMKSQPPRNLVSLATWFQELEPAAVQHGGMFEIAFAEAQKLLVAQQDIVILHGDIHHGNILDFGSRGWLAIDPKGLYGERTFDYANLFCNPDLATATKIGRLARQVSLVAKTAGLDRERLLQWVVAYAGLSAAWSKKENQPVETALAVAGIAAAELALNRQAKNPVQI